MINSLFFPRNNSQLRFWFLFHITLGILTTISSIFIICWFYLVFILGVISFSNNNNIDIKIQFFLRYLFYLIPFELISRMSNSSPIIPFEIGKYLTFFYMIYGISLIKINNKIGYFLIFLILPGIFIGSSNIIDYKPIVTNVLGLINLGLGLVFFGNLKLPNNVLSVDNCLKLLIYPILIALVFAIIKTPDYDDLKFDLAAKFDTSGGFGSNQVSTAFGLGMFLVFYFWLKGVNFSGFSIILDLLISILFLFQGLLTFSRGGIIVGIFCILLFIFSSLISKTKQKLIKTQVIILRLMLFGLPLIIFTLFFVNSFTGGKILLRYQGETTSTINGKNDKTINSITTGRYDIFMEDIDLFLDNPLLGVGLNQSKLLRKESYNVNNHTELSRLLSEHGIFGGMFFLILIYFAFSRMFYLRNNRAIILILFVMGLFTTFHSATRTFISPLLMSLILLPNIKQKLKSKYGDISR